MTAILADIRRYAVKGLNGESLQDAALTPGAGIPHDRRFALAHASSGFDRSDPRWLPKQHFLTLLRDERLAMLDVGFEPESGILTIRRDGRQVARGDITQPLGRMLVEQFLDAFLPSGPRGNPHIVEAPGAMLTDTPDAFVSIINLASVRDIERVARAPVDPRRFRGNLHIDGLPAWAEAGWVGERIRIGDVRLEIVESIGRCAATEVNPDTAERDLHLLKILQQGFAHTICGVYTRVVEGGTIRRGDPVEAPSA